MKKYYLAGPMGGIAQFNFPLFIDVATKLRKQHYTLVTPVELDRETDEEIYNSAMASADGKHTKVDGKQTAGVAGHSWGDLLARDVKLIADQVQGIIFLPNWEKSRGARLEAMVGLLQKDFLFLAWHESEQAAVPICRTTVACMVHVETVK